MSRDERKRRSGPAVAASQRKSAGSVGNVYVGVCVCVCGVNKQYVQLLLITCTMCVAERSVYLLRKSSS